MSPTTSGARVFERPIDPNRGALVDSAGLSDQSTFDVGNSTQYRRQLGSAAATGGSLRRLAGDPVAIAKPMGRHVSDPCVRRVM